MNSWSPTIDSDQFDEDRFRREVVDFLQQNWVSPQDDRPTEEIFRQRAIDAGYVYRNVPVEYGGSGQEPNAIKGMIIAEEFGRVKAPREYPQQSIHLIVPTLLVAGEDWQKAQFIPKTLTGEYRWCQGYSEPGAGSDLASIRTKAVLDNGQWRINGQKVWTTGAADANHIFMLVRTEPDAPKHQGLSYLLVDMNQPGVTVRPLKQITGESHFSEVFFDDARTPANWIVGKRGEGWLVSRKTLVFERKTVGSADKTEALFEKLLRLARTTSLDGAPAIEDALVREEVAKIHGMVTAHRAYDMEQIYAVRRNIDSGPAAGAINKLYTSTILDRIAVLSQKIIGDVAMASPTLSAGGPARWVNQYLNSIAAQLGGGTSNIQRNIIAERHLGLPREDTLSSGNR